MTITFIIPFRKSFFSQLYNRDVQHMYIFSVRLNCIAPQYQCNLSHLKNILNFITLFKYKTNFFILLMPLIVLFYLQELIGQRTILVAAHIWFIGFIAHFILQKI